MSIGLAFLFSATSIAAEFDVGAGFEFVGLAAPGEADAGVGQAEVDARLRINGLGLRVDIDLVEGAPAVGAERAGDDALEVFPEWAAALLGTETGWMLATGFQPLPINNEHQDGWQNPFVPYTNGFAELWPGTMLGIRGQGAVMEGRLSGSLWGGAQAAPRFEVGAPLLGVGVAFGDAEGLRGRAGVTVFPTELEGVASGSVYAPIGRSLQVGADGYLAFGDAVRSSLSAHLVLLPLSTLQPVMRAEWTQGLQGSPWLVDAGVAWRPDDAVRLVFTGRMEGAQPWGFLGVSLLDDVQPGPGWRLR